MDNGKANGFPTNFKNATEDVRAAALAGFLDSDGSIHGNGCRLTQGLAHAKAISDAGEIALSLGIRAGEVYPVTGYKPDGTPTPMLGVYFSGDALVKLQAFMQIGYKRLDLSKLRKMDLDGKLVIARPHQSTTPVMGRSLHFAGRELSLVQLQEGCVVSGGQGAVPAASS